MKVSRGSSGGPVVSGAGIIGMILTDSSDNTHALTIDFIKDAFADWNHPWNLEPSQSQTPGGGNAQPATHGASVGARLGSIFGGRAGTTASSGDRDTQSEPRRARQPSAPPTAE